MVGERHIESSTQLYLLGQLVQGQLPDVKGFRDHELLCDKERQQLITQRLLQIAIPYLIEGITTSSDKNSKKFLYLYDLLKHVKLGKHLTAADLVALASLPEDPGEDEWHHQKGVDGDPLRIAAGKAEFSNLRGRQKHVLEMMIEGRNRVFSVGNDVMTRVEDSSGNTVNLFKPDVKAIEDDLARKQVLYQCAKSNFGVSQSGGEVITVKCMTALAMFEGVSNIGVSQKREISIKMRVPTEAFWQCYFLGTESDEARRYPTMVRAFDQIYSDMIHKGRLDLLRGWTPRSGAMGAEKVNGAFQTDCAFARMLYDQIWDGQKWVSISVSNYEEFEELADEAAALWQGQPVLFPQVFLRLIEFLRIDEKGNAFPTGEMQSEFLAMQMAFRELYSEGVFTGRWLGFNTSLEPISMERAAQIHDFIVMDFQKRRRVQ